MRVIVKEKDFVQIIPESLEDLWFLYNKVDRKVVEQRSLRVKKIKKGGEIIKGKKVLREIAIKVEKKRWGGDKLKVIGKITEGEDRNKYHSFHLELEKVIKIRNFREKLPPPEDYQIFICLIDKEKAYFGIYKSGEIKLIKKILARGRGEQYYKEIANRLEKEQRELLIAGPGVAKDRLGVVMKRRVTKDNVSRVDEKGFSELLKRNSIRRVIEKLRERKEKERVERFLVEIKKNPEKICYGREVENKVERVKEVLVLSDNVPQYEKILQEIERKGGKVNIADSSEDYSREIRKFEIIAALWW